nr:MAG TPA: hypothetical protein [Caudoviricetes sp.]
MLLAFNFSRFFLASNKINAYLCLRNPKHCSL